MLKFAFLGVYIYTPYQRSVNEDKKTSGSGSGKVTLKREVTFLEREDGEKGRGNERDELNIVVPGALTSTPARSLVQMPATRVEMSK